MRLLMFTQDPARALVDLHGPRQAVCCALPVTHATTRVEQNRPTATGPEPSALRGTGVAQAVSFALAPLPCGRWLKLRSRVLPPGRRSGSRCPAAGPRRG